MRHGFFTILLTLSLLGSAARAFAEPQEINREKMLLLFSGEWVSRALYVATKLEIADQLQSEPKSIEALAKLTKSNPDSLYRLMHTLAGFHVFDEISPRVFANTEMSAILAKSHPDTLHSLSLFYGEDIHKSLDELLPSVQSGTPAFQLTFKQPVFSYFKENPARAALFQQSMKEKSMAVIKSALSCYDFSRFKSVYDIGGGYGQFMQALLQKHPQLQGTLFELPEVIKTIRERSPQLENERCSLSAGDFFEAVPKGGDVYLLKSVLHDWDDEKCEKILRHCQQAMEPGSRLLIIDVVLQPKDLSPYANCMDLLMMAITGGKERTLETFKQMLTNTGFVLEGVHSTATEFSILDAIRK